MDYDSNMDTLQELIKDSDNEYNSFQNLADNQSIVCITKNNIDNDIQATFMRSTQRTSFSQTEFQYKYHTHWTQWSFQSYKK